VYGELRQASEPLSPGDRIELVEGLRVDPKIARQRRVAVRRSQVARGKGQGSRKD
jgi:putative ubiquitin-RnfH superfamily antitoxin RatB of RatAB toxin-antitoxin module